MAALAKTGCNDRTQAETDEKGDWGGQKEPYMAVGASAVGCGSQGVILAAERDGAETARMGGGEASTKLP